MSGDRTYAAVTYVLSDLADAQAENIAIRSSHADCEADLLHTIAERDAEIARLRTALESVCIVGDLASVTAARAALGEEGR